MGVVPRAKGCKVQDLDRRQTLPRHDAPAHFTLLTINEEQRCVYLTGETSGFCPELSR